MGRLIVNLAMAVDGVIDVSDWFVGQDDHDDATIPLRLIEAKQFDTGVILLRDEPLAAATPAEERTR